MTRASNYKFEHNMTFPPFSVFVTFVRDTCRIRNDPSFTCQTSQNAATATKTQQQRTAPKQKLSVKKTNVSSVENKPLSACPIHLTDHTLNECRSFRAKPISVRRKFLTDNGICFG